MSEPFKNRAKDEPQPSDQASQLAEDSYKTKNINSNPACGANPAPTPYTTFTKRQKRLLTVLLGLATITSPLTATIYFPLLPLLRTHFQTSAQAINLTITLYIIFQALSPAIFGPLSDSLGRRPIYFATLLIYLVANVALAANRSNSYGVLLGFRALQSLGASAAFAVSYGVVADVCVPSERGSMLGPVSMMLNLGACVGPVVGGWVAYSSGSYEWVFWALVIVAALLVLAVGLLFPETARSVVGNRSEEAAFGRWERTWLELVVSSVRRRRRGSVVDGEKDGAGDKKRAGLQTRLKRVQLRNLLTSLRIIFYKDAFLVLWMHGSFYAVDYSLVAAVPDIYQDIYGFNELLIGLSYLPRGLGIIIGGYCNGRLMDYNYRVIAKKIGWKIDKTAGDDLMHFPIERARSRGSFWLLIISTATLVGYGWAVHAHAHIAVLLVLQFVQGFLGTMFYLIYNTLLVDVFPEGPSAAAAAASISRCAMAAAAVAVLQPLLDATGYGWYFTVLGLWSGVFGLVAVFLIRRKGMLWRSKRSDRGEQELSQ